MKKRTIWKNIILIISVWVIVIVATLAWFVFGTTAQTSDMSMSVGEAGFVEISGDGGGSWSDGLDIEFSVNKYLKEMSGDGTKLYSPVYDVIEKPDGGFGPAIIAYEEVQDNTNYYEQIYDLRSDADYDLYLDPASCVKALSNEEDVNIIGAIRVAFYELDDDANETLKYIWAPNSMIEYSPESDSFNKEGQVESHYYYQKTLTPVDMSTVTAGDPNMAKIPVSTNHDPQACGACGYSATHKFMWSCGNDLPADAPALLNFRLNGQSMSEKRLKIKVWLEGTDRECVSQISGERFTMYFQFKAVKENNNE